MREQEQTPRVSLAQERATPEHPALAPLPRGPRAPLARDVFDVERVRRPLFAACGCILHRQRERLFAVGHSATVRAETEDLESLR